MQFKSIRFTQLLSLLSLLLFGLTVANAQLSEEIRPFDFSNDYYKTNGIIAETLVDRKNGNDGQSVMDWANDWRFGNVRITATLPGYAADGSSIFWNYYGTATKESFSRDQAGFLAVQNARHDPVYVFPSAVVRDQDRQAALIPIDAEYFEKNPLGVAEVLVVEFVDRISRSGQKTLNLLAQRNGTSIDGTPIIKTRVELGSLLAEGLISIRSSESSPFAVAKVMQYPDQGAITPDAFLMYVRQADGQPLAAERHFITQFDCLRNGSRTCLSGTSTTTTR